MLNVEDAKLEEKVTPPESSTEEKTSKEEPNVSEDDKTQEDELGSGSEKFDQRFKEVYREKKELERRLAEKETVTKPDEPEEEFEPKTWNDVLTKVESDLLKKEEAKAAKLKEVEAQVTREINDLKRVDKSIDEDKLWNFMIENKINNVYEAYTKMGHTTTGENKSVSEKIGKGSQNSTGKSGLSYEQLHRMSLDDIDLS